MNNQYQVRILSSEELMYLSYEELFNIRLYPDNFAFKDNDICLDALFQNKNLIQMSDKSILKLLELMKTNKQKFFDYTLFELLKHSEKVRDWAYNNMQLINNNELYIEDKYNY